MQNDYTAAAIDPAAVAAEAAHLASLVACPCWLATSWARCPKACLCGGDGVLAPAEAALWDCQCAAAREL